MFDGLHGDGTDIGVAVGFEEAGGVGAVGLVAHDVGADVARGEEHDGVTEALDLSGPVVSGAAGFHDHGGRWQGDEEGEKLVARQAVALVYLSQAM